MGLHENKYEGIYSKVSKEKAKTRRLQIQKLEMEIHELEKQVTVNSPRSIMIYRK